MRWQEEEMFCFFQQKTAYESTYGDWSSDVCSSDLGDNVEKTEALTTLRQKVINDLNIRTPGHLPCQPKSARSGQEVRFFQCTLIEY